MKNIRKFLLLLLFPVILQGCNTLYHYRLIDIEIVEPGGLNLPYKYSTAAIRYNNLNVAPNPFFAEYYIDTLVYTDTTNIDSIASKIYFDSFVLNLKQQFYFDSITELAPRNYSNVYLTEYPDTIGTNNSGPLVLEKNYLNPRFHLLSEIATTYQQDDRLKTDRMVFDPDYGLYSKSDLQQIADSTNADILISLDYYTSVDGKNYQDVLQSYFVGNAWVLSSGFWNFYNLKTREFEFYHYHSDTIMWNVTGNFLIDAKKLLPPRKDAVLNAAYISGINFRDLIVPHWVEVQRLYYVSGQTELKKTESMIKEGRWPEAAEIWEMFIDNPNKNIAAKSMYNLAVASEMEGDLETAINWTIKSYYVFKDKNPVHSENCMDYIRILSQRKLDQKRIEKQLNPGINPSENKGSGI
jgi:hypothetical protein